MVLSLLLSQDHTTVCAIYSPETMQTKQIWDVYLYGSVHVCRLGETTWVPQCPIQTNYHHPSTCQTSFSPLLNWPAGKKKRERRESLVKSNIHLDARSCRIVKYEVNSSSKTSAKKCIFLNMQQNAVSPLKTTMKWGQRSEDRSRADLLLLVMSTRCLWADAEAFTLQARCTRKHWQSVSRQKNKFLHAPW